MLLNNLFILFILTLFVAAFIKGSNKHTRTDNETLSLQSTNVLKALSCLIILFHHFSLRRADWFDGDFSNSGLIVEILARMGGSYALVVFLFLSGYGITLSELSKSNSFGKFISKRVWKLYKPLIFVCILILISYFILEITHISDYDRLHHRLGPAMTKIGQRDWDILYYLKFIFNFIDIDWYVRATIIFYLLFYISTRFLFSSTIKSSKSLNIYVLTFLFIGYYIFSYYINGQTAAHYWRNAWSFYLGCIAATYGIRNIKTYLIAFLLLAFSFYMSGAVYFLAAILAIASIYLLLFYERYFTLSSKSIFALASISYFLYLIHIRLVYSTLWGIGYTNIIIFFFTAISLAYLLNLFYNRFLVKNVTRK